MTATIRPFSDGDRAAVYDICVATAGAGKGVRGRYSTDDLVPDTAAGPYLFLEPQHAYVLDDGGRAARLGWQPIAVPSVEPDTVLIHPTRESVARGTPIS